MTISSTVVTAWEYTGDGATKPFPFTTKIFASSDLGVYLDGAVQASGYTITGVGEDAGGTVTFTTAPTDQAEVTLLLEVPDEQPSALPLGGRLPSTTIEQELDRRTLISRQAERKIIRSLRYPDTEQGAPTAVLPVKATRLGKLWKWGDTDGEPSVIELVDITPLEISSVGNGLEISGTTLQGQRSGTSLALGTDGFRVQRPVVQRTAEYTLDTAGADHDSGKVFECSGTWAFNLDDTTAMDKSSFPFTIVNTGTGVITLTRAGSDTINDSLTTLAIRPNDWVNVYSDKTNANWRVVSNQLIDADADSYWIVNGDDDVDLVVGGVIMMQATTTDLSLGNLASTKPVNLPYRLQRAGTDVVLAEALDETTITAVSPQTSYTVTWDNTNDYDKIEIEIDGLRPNTGDDTLRLRTSADGGSNYDSGASAYSWSFAGRSAGGAFGSSDNADSEIELSTVIESTDGAGASFKITIKAPGQLYNTSIRYDGFLLATGGNYDTLSGGGQRLSEAAVNGVELAFLTQSIDEAHIRVRGYRK